MALTKTEVQRSYRARHPERAKASNRNWVLNNYEKNKAIKKAWDDANVERRNVTARKGHLKKYGITVEDYARMFQDQKGCCAICLKPERPRRKLSVDHCHTTSRVRKLLCDNCNKMLGFAGEDPQVLLSAVEYLKTFMDREQIESSGRDPSTEVVKLIQS